MENISIENITLSIYNKEEGKKRGIDMEHTVFRKIKEDKGSITLFVLVAMLFFIMVMLLAYTAITNKDQEQIKQIDKIKIVT